MEEEARKKRVDRVTAIREKVYPTCNLVRVCVGKNTVHYDGVTFSYNVYAYYNMDCSREDLLKAYPEVIKEGAEVAETKGTRVTGDDGEIGLRHSITLKENNENEDRKKGHCVVTVYSDRYTPRKTRYYASAYPTSIEEKQRAFTDHIDEDLGNRKTVKGYELQELVNEFNEKSFKIALENAQNKDNTYIDVRNKYEREPDDGLVR